MQLLLFSDPSGHWSRAQSRGHMVYQRVIISVQCLSFVILVVVLRRAFTPPLALSQCHRFKLINDWHFGAFSGQQVKLLWFCTPANRLIDFTLSKEIYALPAWRCRRLLAVVWLRWSYLLSSLDSSWYTPRSAPWNPTIWQTTNMKVRLGKL